MTVKQLLKQEIKDLTNLKHVSRDAIQELAYKVALEFKNVLFNFCMGVGKNRLAGLIGDNKKVLMVVAYTAHIKNVKDDLDKHKINYENWDIIVVDSIHKYKDSEYDVIVLDEADFIIVERVLLVLDSIKREQTILLTGTYNKEKYALMETLFNFKWTISYTQAVRWGIVPEVKHYALRVELDSKNKYLTYKNFGRDINVSETECLELINRDLEFRKKQYFEDRTDFKKINWLRKGLERKQLFDKAKVRTVHDLYNSIEGRKVIYVKDIKETEWFTEIAESVIDGEVISTIKTLDNVGIIHSKQSAKINQELIDKFNNYELETLVNVGVLVRGSNLNEVDHIILGTFTSDGVFLAQSSGRGRLSKSPTVYTPYVADTKNQEDLTKFYNSNNIVAEWV